MKNLILTLAVLAAAATGSRAAIIFSDNFNYADGSVTTAVGSPWTAHSGAGSGPIQVANQQLKVNSSSAEDINATFSGVPYDTTNNPSVTALYSSFTVNVTNLPAITGNYFAHFKDDTTFGFRCRLYAVTTNAAPGTYRLGIASTNSVSTTAGFQAFPIDLATNVAYTVVTRINLITGNSTLWINPTSEDDTSVSSTADPGNILPIFSYAFRQSGGGGTVLVDTLKIGTAFANIAGTNTSPSISSIANRNTPANTATGPISFSVSDAETPDSLIVSATSANQTLVPDANITLVDNGGGSHTVAVNPASGQQGSAVITVSVSDGVNVTTTSFTLKVGAPSIGAVATQITSVNQPVTVSFTVGDTEGDVLLVSTNSSNTDLIPNGNISLGGSGANRTITLTPATGVTGNSTITISVSDGHTTTQTSFAVTVKALIGLVFADEFNYADAPIFSVSDVWIHGSGSGTSAEMQVLNGAVVLDNALTEDVMANLTNGPFASSNGIVLYCSFTLSNAALPSVSGNYFMHYRDSVAGTTFRARVFASTTNASENSFKLGIANSAGAITAASQFPLDIPLNGIVTVVTRYNVGTGESRLWVNPNSENDPGVNAVDTPLPSTVGAIALRQDSGGGPLGIQHLDNLKIGTSYTDVMTVTNTAPPVLLVAKSDNNIVLTWPNPAFALQQAPTVTGTFTNVPGATSPHTNALSGDQQFFRLKN